MATSSWTLKVEFQGERRRLKDWVQEGDEPTVALVRSGAVRLFEIPECNGQGLKLEYKDSDGEVCTLTDMTFPDALCLAVESRTLRVMVCVSEAAGEPPSAGSAADGVRFNLENGGARLRSSLEQFGTSVSSTVHHGRISAHAHAQHFSTSASSGVQAGAEQLRTNTSAHAQQFQANIQESRASLRTSAEKLVQELGSNLQTSSSSLRETVGQVSAEIQTNLQEGRDGFKTRSQQLSGDLRESSLQLRQSLTKSVDGVLTGETSSESSKARVASAVVAGGAVLVVTRCLPLAVALGAIAVGAAGVTAVKGANAQESVDAEAGTNDIASTGIELAAADAEELIDSDVISLPSSDVEDTQSSVVDAVQTGEEEDEAGMVFVHVESGMAMNHSSEAAAE